MTLNRLSVHLIVLSLLLTGGCIVIPVGHSTTGKEIGDADLAFIKVGVTTRSEIVERLGEGVFWKEHNVLAYYWLTETKVAYVVISSGPTSEGHKTFRQNYAVYILFDSNGRVKRFERLQEPKRPSSTNVEEWLARE